MVFSRLFKRAADQPATRPGQVPDGCRIYAIGDIHGRLDLLDALLERIDQDHAGREPARRMLIFLGDLIDRGPDSAQVVERVMALKAASPEDVRVLIGNHEEVMLMALAGNRESLRLFDRIGGRTTMHSYGVTAEMIAKADWDELHTAFAAAVPLSHRAFLEQCEDMIEMGDYAFVHAGIDPARDLNDQKISDLRWIRGTFLNHRHALPRIIVHGHSITESVVWMHSRIGIDTGAYASGRLTALALEGADRRIIDVAGLVSER